MLRLKRMLTIALPVLLLATAPTAYFQSQSAPVKVKVGDVEYNVTATMSGRMLRVDDLDGHMIGMAQVNGSNVSILAPRQG